MFCFKQDAGPRQIPIAIIQVPDEPDIKQTEVVIYIKLHSNTITY